ncbi:hypothetical protein LU632_26185 (plasmid) [Erwinia tracheiphila]|uniref:hypothetical protein n=1 Tax=Erwinia tracheiphila TaxID=65700 RepID=UPI001F344027|nr:hypothetical protein [Erwinia tracheiphila]UIA94528.1 hypothetical protein LU632_26185 [Erwinia tracheiphila]
MTKQTLTRERLQEIVELCRKANYKPYDTIHAENIARVCTSESVEDMAIALLENASQMDELTMWVKRLAHSLRNAKPDSKLHSDAMEYLSRKELIRVEDILR